MGLTRRCSRRLPRLFPRTFVIRMLQEQRSRGSQVAVAELILVR